MILLGNNTVQDHQKDVEYLKTIVELQKQRIADLEESNRILKSIKTDNAEVKSSED